MGGALLCNGNSYVYGERPLVDTAPWLVRVVAGQHVRR